MGTWGTKIMDNDTTADIYSNFFDKYNKGGGQAYVSKEIKKEFHEYFNDYEDKNNSFFGLAQAQWETKSLEPEVYEIVKGLIENGTDLKLWKELDADKAMIAERKVVLENFLKQISTEKPKAKRRVKPKYKFTMNELANISPPDDNKVFTMNEEFRNGEYIHTSGIMMWKSGGGGGVLYFEGLGKNITAEWINNNKLKIVHDSTIDFTMKRTESSYYTDDVEVEYCAE